MSEQVPGNQPEPTSEDIFEEHPEDFIVETDVEAIVIPEDRPEEEGPTAVIGEDDEDLEVLEGPEEDSDEYSIENA